MLLFAAVGVVVQLKNALNTVWEVESRKKGGIWQFVRTYLVSLAGVLALGFLLLVSLLLTTALSASSKYLVPHLPEAALQIVGSIASFGVITLLFATMFKWLPDTPVRWRDVWLGAAITAALFEIGELLIGLYIGKQALESTYGAAASLVVLLIWIYYSSQIVLMGAEFTHVYAIGSPKQVPDPVQPWLQWPMATGIPQEPVRHDVPCAARVGAWDGCAISRDRRRRSNLLSL